MHRAGAPAAICLSCPCPADPVYTVDLPPRAFSICSAIRDQGIWHFGAEESSSYRIVSTEIDKTSARAVLLCTFGNHQTVTEHYGVDASGVSVDLHGAGQIGLGLPAFSFDGDIHPRITRQDRTLTVSYDGWICRYITDGAIVPLDTLAANRNGHYLMFVATGQDRLHVTIQIEKQ